MSRITITVNGQSLVGNTHQPLLEQLEQAGLQPEFQCRNGVCGACRCKLQKGSVSQQDTMAYLAAGEILTCSAIPAQNIELDFDYQVSFVARKAVNL
ncbi:class I ribonucleotide reductase maintenance protein YfaE [Enterovibrio sp. ZSDZ35]|uniref:Class I ribonucleotide reductase maintenance protein YfaE n=1 Tax=Enterovibrio qingdaonensis TaxID=2899818 RepID=A0ABT5QNB2_9GAMM|nr:class I ribonucleotide reductase maintenance protein YfaE [Enterovibrio sp. ZSDZ35]MDD1781756.1 class I ribonucleotide reductase maintenance protein YfaE [Enterovibrio sp. ZSDZ35]